MHVSTRNRRAGFTALQLIVMLAILVFGLAFMLPLVARVREAAARAQSTNNLKQIGIAMHNYHDVANALPPGVGSIGDMTGPTHFYILPYIEQEGVFRRANGAPWRNGANETVIPVFLDPRDQTLPDHRYKNWLATTNYPVNWKVTKEGNQRLQNILDGTANTLCFAERYQLCNGQPTAWGYPVLYEWAPIFAYYSEEMFQSAPAQSQCDPRRPQSIDRVMLATYCDGSVRPIAPSIRPSTWYYLCDPSDGQALNDPNLD